ncbi:MAG: hypothetical protein OXP28_14015 [Gammaproteobacteria bacterium]|nr:hypothetical protein [Gammaproteobacteria bacterium]
MKRRTFAMALAIIGISISAHAQVDGTGWHFSRANCIGANESITWKAVPDPSIGAQIIPRGLWTGIRAYRRTVGHHEHKHTGVAHTLESSSTLEWTWRAHAGHFPIPESFPYLYLTWERRLIVTRIPIRGGSRGRGDRPRYRTVTKWVRVPVWKLDTKPWTVDGEHWEQIGLTTTYGTSSATGCNWADTFNSM